MKTFFKTEKYKMFPEIRDWNSPQDKYRFNKDIKGMDFKYFFWFCPHAYKLITYGFNIFGVINFTLFGLYIKQFAGGVFALFPLAIIVYNIVDLYNKLRKRKYMKDYNFYDLYLREYLEG